MITDTMSYKELYKEIIRFNGFLSTRGDGWLKKHHKSLKKEGTQCLSCQKIDTNLYFILYTKVTKKIKAFGFIYIYLRDNKWHAFLEANKHGVFNVDMEIYEPHFFSRYNERFNINKTGIDLIFQYFKDNINEFSAVKNQEYNNKTYRLSNIKGGMAICEPVKEGNTTICFYKTCISNEMLFKSQVDIQLKINKELDLINNYINK